MTTSKETFHPLLHHSRWVPRPQGAHDNETNLPPPDNQVGVPTLKSSQLCPHSHDYVHIQSHSPLSPWFLYPVLHDETLLITL